MARMDVSAAVTPAYRHMVSMLFRPFNLKKWLALGFVSLLMGGSGGGSRVSLPGNTHEPSTGDINQAMQWMAAHWVLMVAAGVAFVILAVILSWLGSIFRLVYTDQVVKNSYAIKEPFARLKELGTSLFLWQIGFGFVLAFAILLLAGAPVALAFGLDAARWAQILSVAWGLGIFFAIMLVGIVVNLFTLELVSGVMYTRGVGVLEAWRLFMPRMKENVGQSALYILLLFAFAVASVIIALLAMFIVLLVLAIPFGGVFLIAMFIGKAAGLVWTAATVSIAVIYGVIFFTASLYALTCVLQPVSIFLRSFSLAVLGQMDESFATIPTGLEPLPRDRQ